MVREIDEMECSLCTSNGQNIIGTSSSNNKKNKGSSSSCIKLFGVKIAAAAAIILEEDCREKRNDHVRRRLRKCRSTGNLQSSSSSSSCKHVNGVVHDVPAGYLSDGIVHELTTSKAIHERKRGLTISRILIHKLFFLIVVEFFFFFEKFPKNTLYYLIKSYFIPELQFVYQEVTRHSKNLT